VLSEIGAVSSRLFELIDQFGGGKTASQQSQTVSQSMEGLSDIRNKTGSGIKEAAGTVNTLANLADETARIYSSASVQNARRSTAKVATPVAGTWNSSTGANPGGHL